MKFVFPVTFQFRLYNPDTSVGSQSIAVMDPGRAEAGFDLRTGPTDLKSKTGRYWKSDIEFGLKARTEPGPASETLGPDSTDKSREI